MAKNVKKWDFRDVSLGLQKLRNLLIGRKHVGHGRFMPLISPRSIPPPDIPRTPYYKYSDQWYGNRHALGSVKPPVVAPVAEGRPKSDCGSVNPNPMDFATLPTPGSVWWFDAHCYFKEVSHVAPCVPPPPASTPCKPVAKKKVEPCPPKPAEKVSCHPSLPERKEPKIDCDPCKPKKT